MTLPHGRKEIIVRRIIQGITTERLTNKEIARLFSVPTMYMSHMKNQKMWGKVPEKVWRLFNRWEESGDELKEFAVTNSLTDHPLMFASKDLPHVDEESGEVTWKDPNTVLPKPPEPEVDALFMIDLRVAGMKPTDDPELIQQRIDQLVKALDERSPDTEDTIKDITTKLDVLYQLGYHVSFSIELNKEKE